MPCSEVLRKGGLELTLALLMRGSKARSFAPSFVHVFCGRPLRQFRTSALNPLHVRHLCANRLTLTRAVATNAAASNSVAKSPSSNGAQSQYSASDIHVLQGLEPVRKRPGMYIRSTGPRGLHHLVFEEVDNAVDEALAGHFTRIEVAIHPDGSLSVRDDGRGIPTNRHSTTGKSALETALTVLHAGGKFGGAGYQESGGLHGVGLSVVNALSEQLTVDVWRNGYMRSMKFACGNPQGDVEHEPAQKRDNDLGGTHVRFMPDPQIFTTTVDFDFNVLARRLEELAFLNAGLKIVLREEQ